jgi:L-malate glycosyltransferase
MKGLKKLCVVGNSDSIHLQRWSKYFIAKGYDVHIITGGNTSIPGAIMHRIKTISKLNQFVIPLQIWLLLVRIKPDIVHAHCFTGYGFYTAITGFRPLIVSAWGSDILVHAKKFYYRFRIKLVMRRAGIIHSVSDVLSERLCEQGAKKMNIVTIPLGINTNQFFPDIKSDLKEVWGLEKQPIVISLRNFESIYDINCLIDAIPIVLESMPNTKFLILGKGSLEEELKQRTRDLRVSSSVRFGGYIDHDKLHEYLVCVDAYVSTARSDSLGIANLEAMACGIPVVLGDIPINKELKDLGLEMELFKVGDSEDLAKKIEVSLKKKKSWSNYHIIRGEFDAEENFKLLERVYLKMIEGK